MIKKYWDKLSPETQTELVVSAGTVVTVLLMAIVGSTIYQYGSIDSGKYLNRLAVYFNGK